MANFEFLRRYWPRLADMASLAENYLYTDPNTALIKVGMFAEQVVAEMFAYENLRTPETDDSQAARIRILKREGLLPSSIDDILYVIRKKRNDATHQYLDSQKDAVTVLEMAYQLACWFMEVYGDWGYIPQPFALPIQEPEVDYASIISEKEAALAAQAAEIASLRDQVHTITVAVASSTRQQRQQKAEQSAGSMNATEAETRMIIDTQLRAAGWEADTNVLRYSKGTRPVKGRNIAIAEWPTDADDGGDGRVDYALFIGTQLVGMIEAKRASKSIVAILDVQCKEYGTHVRKEDQVHCLGSWNGYSVPFVFATNGRKYFPQWPEKSGVWFKDARITVNDRRALHGWPSPQGLLNWLNTKTNEANNELENTPYDILRDPEGLNLYDYQMKAVEEAEKAIIAGKKAILLAMATGTGKTRVALALIYRLLTAERFKRILFLVDRNFLGEQAEEKFTEVKLKDFLALNQIFPMKKLGEKGFDPETRLKITTVQSMVRQIMGDDTTISVSDYDLIIVDEAHRGYFLDKEMADAEMLYRDEADYLSKYRQIIEYFDAVKIGLTATPALHTTEIFGKAVFTYTYREAVVDVHLIDHDLPHNILSHLLKEGITYLPGERPVILNPYTGELENGDELEDELHFDIEQFNKKIMTRPFTTTMLNEVAKDIDPEGEGKTLIFAASDEHADMIVEILRGIYGEQGIPSEAIQKITGSIGEQKDIRSAIRRFDNERWPNIVVTVDLLTTGFDNPKITALVFLRKIKSRILYEQMIGRATRKCDEIHKDHFEIFDCVRLYEDLAPVTNIHSVQTKESFESLLNGLERMDEPDMIQAQIQKIAAKLHRKMRFITPEAVEQFKDLTGGYTLPDFAEEIKTKTPEEAKTLCLDKKEAFILLDNDHPKRQGKIIDDHPDELLEHTRGYGAGQKPEDYLESFGEFVRTHINDIEALKILVTRPADLTREALRSLKLELDRHSFSEQQLNSAWRAVTNQEITADIIAFIRQQALGSALISHEQRVKHAFAKLRLEHVFTANQRNWLDRIEKTMLEESILDESLFDRGAYKTSGGFKMIDKRFGGTLREVIAKLNEYLYDDRGAA